MTIEELRAAIAAMLYEETQPVIDWARVEALSFDLITMLVKERTPELPRKLYHFIEDWDIRRKDERDGRKGYAEDQRAFVEQFVRGE